MEAIAAGSVNKVYSVSIADKINAYISNAKINITAVAKEVNYARSTVSRYLSGKYDSDASELEAKLIAFLADKTGEQVSSAQTKAAKLAKRKVFFESRDAKNVIGVCAACQEDIGLGIVVGRSGYGKTYALKHYAKMPRVAYVECDDTMGCRDLVEAIEKAVGLPMGYGTIWRRVNSIRDFFNVNKGYLLVIDEADKLVSKYTSKKMEILRGIFDQSDVGMIIAGEPKLEVMIKTQLLRFANRIDFYASLKGLSSREVEGVLGDYDIDGEALAELKLRACNAPTGCFRLFDRTLHNAIRIMQDSGGEQITLKVIQQASNMMML